MEENSVLLFIGADDFDPAEITALLGIQPYQSWRKGDSELRSRGRTHVYENSRWKFLPDEATNELPLEDQLEYWIERLSPLAEQLAELRRRGCSLELNCFILSDSEFSFYLAPETLTRLGALGLELAVENICYPCSLIPPAEAEEPL